MINTWPGWENTGLLGEGSYGKVYKIQRQEYGQTYEAALKVITIPASQSDVHAAYDEGMDEESVTRYFHSFVEDIVAEFALMSQLKGNSHIVSYEDHMVVQHEGEVGWDILIRMELLTALPAYAAKHPLTEEDVIRLGIHMCRALALCRSRGIIHRDIKPENIFVSQDGNFKLGDFGVARVAEKTVTVMSRKGTYNFMAPEVYKGEKYGYAADLCSLGLVLYRCLNDNRIPFLPPYPQPIQYSDREMALEKRMSGEPIPAPVHGRAALQSVVLKACAYRPEDRFATAEEMERALEDVLAGREKKHKEKRQQEKRQREKAPATWYRKSAVGIAGFVAALLLGTMFFCWEQLFYPEEYLDIYFMQGYGAFSYVTHVMTVLVLTLTLMWRVWSRLWQPERTGKTIAAAVGLLVLGFILGATEMLGSILGVVASLIEYPIPAVLGLVFVMGLWFGWHVLDKKELIGTRMGGMLVTAALLIVIGVLLVREVEVYGSHTIANMRYGWIRGEFHDISDTPQVLAGTCLHVVLLGWNVMLAGHLWAMPKKWGKLAWAALMVAEFLLLFLPLGWILQLCLDLVSVPVITLIGLVLSMAILWGVSKLFEKMRRRRK